MRCRQGRARPNLFVLFGNPKDAAHGSKFRDGTSQNGCFVCPDDLAFDPKGQMFVAADGANDFGPPGGIGGVSTDGPARGLPKLPFACPVGAEAAGPGLATDGTSLFVSIRHPAEDSDTLARLCRRRPAAPGGEVAA
jgi:hypothetical protein